MTGARWRAVPGYESSHLVSSDGLVVSLPRNTTSGGLLKQTLHDGYPAVHLWRDGKDWTVGVHILVALTFIGPRPPGSQVRHLDGNRRNPDVSNLAYGTPSQNGLDKRAHGTDHNVNKTHCPQGHPYDELNTYTLPSRPNARYCKECQRVRTRARYHRTKARTSAPGWREEWAQ